MEIKNVEEISRIVKENVGKTFGMTNRSVNNICQSLCPNIYEGLYDKSELKDKGNFLIHKKIFSIIVNIGRHYVCIYAEKDFSIYIDPLGFASMTKEVNSFLQKIKRKTFTNTSKLQRLNSNHCGMYAIMFCKHFDLDKKNRPKMVFYKKQNNDNKCIHYLKKLIEK